ncbi:hypothetical protein [Chryseobacterium taiwanense]|uniref:Uncharacterized protein n=1 Tax=Chryseobacterium taiwanense TaxID=363331 RepID=A0A0B4D7K4_9FLAO|nr:hypothetical protein [Chryseobacterium taiwanense]KIC62696.1 hypothetical protein RM51_10900 [Chryseobacterium taiwanense]
MIENDTSKFIDLYEKKEKSENETIVQDGVNTYGATAFLVKSLNKLKANTRSELLKKLIEKYIREYLFHIKDNLHHDIVENASTQTPFDDPSFTLYAKTAYNKVLKEEECLNGLLDTLKRNDF